MASEKDIQKEIRQVSSLKTLTEVYGEIAASRMKKIREFVLRNREFLGAIESIFQDALASYASKLSDLVRQGKMREGGKVTFLAHNGKTVVVLISANTGFYGEVVKQTFDKFLEGLRRENVEVTIIGKLGRSLFLQEEPDRPYTYFELPDFGIDKAAMSEAIVHLVQYEEIRVYYGKYQSVINQTPTTFKITAGTPISGTAEKPEVEFIFEPSMERILMFFETQIFASLFDQAVRESQLAKFASRILAMDRASENIDQELSKLKLESLKISHKVENSKQLNSLVPVFSQTVKNGQ